MYNLVWCTRFSQNHLCLLRVLLIGEYTIGTTEGRPGCPASSMHMMTVAGCKAFADSSPGFSWLGVSAPYTKNSQSGLAFTTGCVVLYGEFVVSIDSSAAPRPYGSTNYDQQYGRSVCSTAASAVPAQSNCARWKQAYRLPQAFGETWCDQLKPKEKAECPECTSQASGLRVHHYN